MEVIVLQYNCFPVVINDTVTDMKHDYLKKCTLCHMYGTVSL